MQGRNGQPVGGDVRYEVTEPGHCVGVVEVVVVTRSKNGHNTAARCVNRTLIRAARAGAEDLADLVEL
ncbi:hypothetical protein A245_44495, partial [Pseudomonas syringae pv. actinidiae ICMP 19096]